MQTKSINYKILLTFEQQCRSFRICTDLDYLCLFHFAVALNSDSILALLNLKQSYAYCSFSRSVSLPVSTPSPRGQSQRPSSSLSCQGSPHFILCRLAMCCFYLFYFFRSDTGNCRAACPQSFHTLERLQPQTFQGLFKAKSKTSLLDIRHASHLIGQHSVLSCLLIFHAVSFSDDV